MLFLISPSNREKIQQFGAIQTRVDTHNTELNKRDELLRDAHKSLVNRTGELVGGEDEAASVGDGGVGVGGMVSRDGEDQDGEEEDDAHNRGGV